MKPIYTIYQATECENGLWTAGEMINVVNFSSKLKARKSIKARYTNLVLRKGPEKDIKFHEREGLQEPWYEFTFQGKHYQHYIVQHILV